MANYFTDNPILKHYLQHPLMQRIMELRERNFRDAALFDYAPSDADDCMDSYEKVLEICGEICADVLEENAESIDQEGPVCKNGRVEYAEGTLINLEATIKAGLMGMAIPRPYGGLNFPVTPFIMAAELVSRADAGFENIWGLQECAETLYEFGTEEQRQAYLGRVCAGETMSMDLTEPDAGSDLQAVMLKASLDESDNSWRLNGVKRFITNGDADIHLVLARSEEGTKDGRGLSMFIYDKRNGGLTVRRIENKMGIKGAPTCELVFKDAKAELCGNRRLGLIKYVMALMNGARLGIAAQSVGLCEATYREALCYARSRKQFDKAIIEFPPVFEMLALMKAKLDAIRSLLYETSRFVDVYKCLEDIARERNLSPEERTEMKTYSRWADAYTPLAKGMGSEFANQNAYDAIQIHGGSGYMKDYACERHYRDARITSIYEGTTQLQVIAAIRHVTTGTYLEKIKAYQQEELIPELASLRQRLLIMTAKYEEMTAYVTGVQQNCFLDLCARRLVEMAGHIIMSELLLKEAATAEELRSSAKVYVTYAESEISRHETYIKGLDSRDEAYLEAFRPCAL
ncbi:MAG: Acyl-CoA dehydrogenase C-terminal domain-containing protein [Bacteroidales bacterium]|nr:Acyl-CoA dehydrogenase C-terminal domain-containing protein [Bacteroidales bacterium]MDD4639788.1 Acyl-CoA dehydrogenase C-terminal domain-containing protein [Bacteroidales bacterium]